MAADDDPKMNNSQTTFVPIGGRTLEDIQSAILQERKMQLDVRERMLKEREAEVAMRERNTDEREMLLDEREVVWMGQQSSATIHAHSQANTHAHAGHVHPLLSLQFYFYVALYIITNIHASSFLWPVPG